MGDGHVYFISSWLGLPAADLVSLLFVLLCVLIDM